MGDQQPKGRGRIRGRGRTFDDPNSSSTPERQQPGGGFPPLYSGPPRRGPPTGPPSKAWAPAGPPSKGGPPSGPPPRGWAPAGPPSKGGPPPSGPPSTGGPPSGPPSTGGPPSGPPPRGWAPAGPPSTGGPPSGPPSTGGPPSGPPPRGGLPSGRPPVWGLPRHREQTRGPFIQEQSRGDSAKTVAHPTVNRKPDGRGDSDIASVPSTSDSASGSGLRRGSVRGKRQLHEDKKRIVCSRPESLVTKQGVTGTKITLSSNYFKLLQKTDWCLYQYRVDIAPEEDRTLVKKALFRIAAKELSGYIFDGTVLYTSIRLTPDPKELYVQDTVTDNKYRFSIRLVADLAKGDYQYIQVFNIIMRKCLGHLNLQLVGRNFFDAAARIQVQNQTFELWPGYVTSIRQHEESILMCVEIAHKVMCTTHALNLLEQCARNDHANYKSLFQSRIVGSVVLTAYNNRTYHIDDVDFKSTPLSTFNMRDGSSVSFKDYFAQKYNLRVTCDDQPMLISRAKAREIRSGMAETIYLVPEFCRLTGLTEEQRSNFQLMRDLAIHTRVNAKPRMERLMNFSRRLRNNPEVVSDLRKWNWQLAEQLIQFEGRVLPREVITGGNSVRYEPGEKLEWSKEMRTRPMLAMANLKKWVCICPSRLKSKAHTFVQTLIRAAKGMDWNIGFPELHEIRDDRPGTYMDAIEWVQHKYEPQFLLCIASNNKQDRYAAIKKKCCADYALPSQVLLAKSMDNKGVMSIATKVAIQMNCKLGGAPWCVGMPYSNIMIVGFDVCHDTNHKELSYGAMVASTNRHCSKYFSTVSPHKSGQELSDDFALSILKACNNYLAENKCLPDRILIYRDGVGDGQLPTVFDYEVGEIRKKLVQVYGSADKVKLCFIVVSKRINTRFFHGTENPKPGTVVDSTVTLPERYDFFIVSQCVNQGTVAPTSYNILYDSMGADADKLQRLTYKMTHMYFNWSGTVRVPAPCQYAHKLAFLIAQNVHRSPHPALENTLYFL